MSLSVRPQREDFFPRLRRGHGSTHPQARFIEPVKVRDGNPCVEATCILNAPKSKTLHIDTRANMKEWCDEHRLSVVDKDHKHAQYLTPIEAMYAVTGGRC